MSNLPARSTFGGLAHTKVRRQASREIAFAHAEGVTLAARESAKVDAIAEVTESALMATSHISAVEALLIDRTPHAEGRLRHIGDRRCTRLDRIADLLEHRFLLCHNFPPKMSRNDRTIRRQGKGQFGRCV